MKVIKAEAEKRRQAKEDAERKRQATEQKERERLQELIHQKQREHEEQTKLKKEEENGMQETADDRGGPEEEPVVPSIVNDRIKMFKDGEKAKKEKEEVYYIVLSCAVIFYISFSHIPLRSASSCFFLEFVFESML